LVLVLLLTFSTTGSKQHLLMVLLASLINTEEKDDVIK